MHAGMKGDDGWRGEQIESTETGNVSRPSELRYARTFLTVVVRLEGLLSRWKKINLGFAFPFSYAPFRWLAGGWSKGLRRRRRRRRRSFGPSKGQGTKEIRSPHSAMHVWHKSDNFSPCGTLYHLNYRSKISRGSRLRWCTPTWVRKIVFSLPRNNVHYFFATVDF